MSGHTQADVGTQWQSAVVTLRKVRLHAITELQCVSYIVNCLRAGKGGWVVTANLDHLRRMATDDEYAQLCASASLIVPDGMPLIWASRIQGTPLPERVTGSDLIWSLSEAAAANDLSIFMLGGAAGTAEGAADALTGRFPALRVAGAYCPPMGFQKEPSQIQRISRELCDARPDIVFAALGSPKQERLISRLRHLLPCAWWLGVGISFSFLCGKVRRAPEWLQRIGLEWLHRLFQEPQRLARRYLREGLPFAGSLLVDAAARGAVGRLANRRSLRSVGAPGVVGRPEVGD